MRTVFHLTVTLALGGTIALAPQERIDQDVFWKIRQEGTDQMPRRSQPQPAAPAASPAAAADTEAGR